MLEMKDRGMTNAALPTITKPNMIALNAIDLPGLHDSNNKKINTIIIN
jgi:hypothetical protein